MSDPASILALLEKSEIPLTSSDICRALRIKGDDRRDVRDALKELEQSGDIIKLPGQKYTVPDGLPSVTTVEIHTVTVDGDMLAVPADWNDTRGKPPVIDVAPGNSGHPPLKEGDRALVRLRRLSANRYEAKIMKVIDGTVGRIMGEVQKGRGADRIVRPFEKRSRGKDEFDLATVDAMGADLGDLVIAEILPSRGVHRRKVKVIDIIGHRDDPRAISLIAAHEKGVRDRFPDDALRDTEDMIVPDLGQRTDLRAIPLVTIDGEDARDFDDAVFAEKDGDGFHLIVAIADVSHYVRPGSALDREAYKRGNSTYFPDRVMPMLPEKLSNDLCSLRPKENRACLAAHLWIDAAGQLQRFQFVRGLMKSVARLTYTQVQRAMDGQTDDTTDPLMQGVIRPLYDAYRVLDAARIARGALDLDLPERKITLDANGVMNGVALRERYDSHKLIEEFMILANVAAARALMDKNAPCIYRIHDRPSAEKLMYARDFLESFGLTIAKTGITAPSQLNHLLRKADGMEYKHLVHETLLRTQAQAVYSPDNIGHFGLALRHYAHFTSPIRRYADLVVHRSLIRACRLGDGGLSDDEAVRLEEISEHISATERASSEAERNAVDRFCAAFLSTQIGAVFKGRVSGVTRFGLFVRLDESGADGLIPIRTLPQDYYHHDERQHALIGRRAGLVFRLGDRLDVSIAEADAVIGSILFALAGTDRNSPPQRRFNEPNRSDSTKRHRPDKRVTKNNDGGKGPRRKKRRR